MKYTCQVCGYVYDPAENGGVAFEDLPADWVCPLCGVGKDQFIASQVKVKNQGGGEFQVKNQGEGEFQVKNQGGGEFQVKNQGEGEQW